MGEEAIYNVIVGTAGHIDHGKSSIVRYLSGVNPDRLPEEQQRGLTIDLGFAPMELPSGQWVGIVDVPGHERFIKNMVAGASSIDLVILVVAADDSVMPQTREHLDIMTLLGVQRGIIAINKIDLIDPEMLELVEEEIREVCEQTFLADAPIYRVSAVTGEGMAGLKRELEQRVLEIPRHDPQGLFRMPIQRVFSAKGHGTVITGIPVSGSVSIGEKVEILPTKSQGRIRGLQAYKLSVETAQAGHSTAMNLGDIDYRDVQRGMVAATPGYFQSTDMLETTITVLPHLKMPVKNNMAIRLHTGTSEVVGTVHLLERKLLHPGESSYAQFRLAAPIVVAPGDRYVYRMQSPMMTLGGGEVLDRSAWRLKGGKDYVLTGLSRKREALGSQRDFLASLIAETPFRLFDSAFLAKRASLPEKEVTVLLAELEVDKEVLAVGGGPPRFFSVQGIEAGRQRVVGALQKCYEEDEFRIFVSKLEVRDAARFESEFFDALVVHLADRRVIESRRGGRLSLPKRKLNLKPLEQKAYNVLRAQYSEQPFSPPRPEVLATDEKLQVKMVRAMQKLLIDQEVFTRVSGEIVLHSDAIDEARERLQELYNKEGAFTASSAKDALETSRRFAIPLLEYFDEIKITRRLGDTREMVD